jgi:hypothetical protein
MDTPHKCALCFSAWIVWIFALTAALAWYTFGYVDLVVVRGMVLLVLPLLAAAVAVLVWSERPEKPRQDDRPRASAPGDAHGSNELRHVDVR